MTVDLRYAQTKTYTTGSAGVAGTENAFSLNSLYDPDITGVGHQPYGFDQMASLYSNYIVESVSIQARFVTIGGSADVCCILALTGQYPVSTTGITVDAAVEKAGITTKTLTASGVNRTAIIDVPRVPIHRTLGLTRAQYENELNTYGAAVSSSPSTQSIVRINVASYNGTASEDATCQVTIVYHAKFFNRVVQAQS